jgi:antitoxin HicB
VFCVEQPPSANPGCDSRGRLPHITDQELFMSKRYTVSDGRLVLNLEEAEEGGYIVTSPFNPELITQAETIQEAFANARDAAKALKQSRARLMRRSPASTSRG